MRGARLAVALALVLGLAVGPLGCGTFVGHHLQDLEGALAGDDSLVFRPMAGVVCHVGLHTSGYDDGADGFIKVVFTILDFGPSLGLDLALAPILLPVWLLVDEGDAPPAPPAHDTTDGESGR